MDTVRLVDLVGDEVAVVPRAVLVAQGGPTDVIVWRGRVFRPDPSSLVWCEVSTVVVEMPFGCPVCGVERTDYEGEPGRYLPGCPNCTTRAAPVLLTSAQDRARQVMVSRDLLVACRSEIRTASGHWARGFTGTGAPIMQHDARGVGGQCVTCSLLELLDGVLYQGEGVGAGGAVT